MNEVTVEETKKITVKSIKRRVDRVKATVEAAARKKKRAKVIKGVIRGIADGSIASPRKAAEALLDVYSEPTA